MVITVGIHGVDSANAHVFLADQNGEIEGPVLGAGVAYNYRDLFVAYRKGLVTAIVVRGADIYGHAPTANIALSNGNAVDCEPIEIAMVKTKDSASIIMWVVWDIDRGMDVLRIIEVTDHIEDLVVPVRVRTLGDPRREPNLTKAEWKQRRDAMNAMRLKFQQIVLSRGVRPPHMPVHVGDPEAKGSRPHPVPRSTAVPK